MKPRWSNGFLRFAGQKETGVGQDYFGEVQSQPEEEDQSRFLRKSLNRSVLFSDVPITMLVA